MALLALALCLGALLVGCSVGFLCLELETDSQQGAALGVYAGTGPRWRAAPDAERGDDDDREAASCTSHPASAFHADGQPVDASEAPSE